MPRLFPPICVLRKLNPSAHRQGGQAVSREPGLLIPFVGDLGPVVMSRGPLLPIFPITQTRELFHRLLAGPPPWLGPFLGVHLCLPSFLKGRQLRDVEETVAQDNPAACGPPGDPRARSELSCGAGDRHADGDLTFPAQPDRRGLC